MLRIILYFLTSGGGFEIVVEFPASAGHQIVDLLRLFGTPKDDPEMMDAIQQATPELKAALARFVQQHAQGAPHLHRLKKKICDLPDGAHFLILPEKPKSTREELDWQELLHQLNNPEAQPLASDRNDTFGELLEHYDLTAPSTDRPNVIGNRRKADRSCRFCRQGVADGATFNSIAHAIPTALGNDHLKLADECDACNSYFGRETEPSLIAMLDIARAFLGTQGRGKNAGRPKLRFKQGAVQHDGLNLNIEARDIVTNHATGEMTVKLGTGGSLVPLAIYRALVKIAVSVVEQDVLTDLKDTIAWVRYGTSANRPLPLVAKGLVNLPPNPSAQIVVYRRKTETSRLPHLVGEFRLGPFMFVYAVPFSANDSWDLVGFFDDPDFQQVFKHYRVAAQWTLQDLSATQKVPNSPVIKFAPRTP